MPYNFGGDNYNQQQFLAQALMQSAQNNASPLASGLGSFAGALLASKAMKTKEDSNKQLADLLMNAKTQQERANIALQSQEPSVQKLGMSALFSSNDKPYSNVGKIQADLAAGRIDPQTAQAALTKATTVSPMFGGMLTPYQQRQLELQDRKITAQEKKAATGTALPRPVVNDLMQKSTTAEGYGRLMAGFNDNYAGQPLTGRMMNAVGRTFGDNGQAQWWQDYDAQANIVRNELFGSALSEGEQRAWEQAAINPGMNPKQIKANLNRQNEIVTKALRRLSDVYRKGGYNQEQINSIMPSGSIDATVGAQGGGSMLPNVQPGQSVAEAAAGGENIPNGGNIQPIATKTLNGKTYIKTPQGWFEQ